MTKKERTIKACRELAAKYRKPEGKEFFRYAECALCKISGKMLSYQDNCYGCPLADKNGQQGCGKFRTYRNALNEKRGAFNARAAFFDKIIPILEKIPASRFTKRGWEYFSELDRSW